MCKNRVHKTRLKYLTHQYSLWNEATLFTKKSIWLILWNCDNSVWELCSATFLCFSLCWLSHLGHLYSTYSYLNPYLSAYSGMKSLSKYRIYNQSPRVIGCQWVCVCICLFVPYSSETAELKFWGKVPLWNQIVLD